MLSNAPPDKFEECTSVLRSEVPNLRAPSLEALAYALRHPETWPKGFAFDFESCPCCAMGLARALWYPREEIGKSAESWICATANKLGIPAEVAAAIFLNGRLATTPSDAIAERLEYYLELRTFLFPHVTGSANQTPRVIVALRSAAVLMKGAIEVLKTRASERTGVDAGIPNKISKFHNLPIGRER
jgi:hypothetical protein